MKPPHWVLPSLGVAILCSLPGCLIVRHSTNVVREHENKQTIRFESEQAQNEFEAGLAVARSHRDNGNGLSDVFAVPFVCWFSSTNVLSDNAMYNDAAKTCDANGDGFITLKEAMAYKARVSAKWKDDESKEPAGEANLANGTPVTIHGRLVLDSAPKVEGDTGAEISVSQRPPEPPMSVR